MAEGNFDGESREDLAIGVPAKNSNRGVIHILYLVACDLRTDDEDLRP